MKKISDYFRDLFKEQAERDRREDAVRVINIIVSEDGNTYVVASGLRLFAVSEKTDIHNGSLSFSDAKEMVNRLRDEYCRK